MVKIVVGKWSNGQGLVLALIAFRIIAGSNRMWTFKPSPSFSNSSPLLLEFLFFMSECLIKKIKPSVENAQLIFLTEYHIINMIF